MILSSLPKCLTTLTFTQYWRSVIKLDMNDTNFSTLLCKQQRTYPEHRASIVIWKVVPPILILLGTAGNILSILVLRRKAIRKSTTALYLTVLAFSDLTVLYTGLFRQWMIYAFGIDVREFGNFGCKINIWLVVSSLDYSAWILIVVTLERVISAWLPHRAKGVCRKTSATAFLISIGVFIVLLNGHLMYGMGIDNTNGSHKCEEVDDNYRTFFNKTWPWVDLCVYCVIPSSVIVIGNGLILTKVVKSQNKVNACHSVKTSGERHHHIGSGKHSYMTAILFALNIVFLISATPISIYNVGFPYWADTENKRTFAQLDLWWAIVNMFMYGNNTFNFFLYCLSGSKFRHEVILIFCSKRTNVPSSTTSAQHLLHRVNINCTETMSPKRVSGNITKSLPGTISLPQPRVAALNSVDSGICSQDLNMCNVKSQSCQNVDMYQDNNENLSHEANPTQEMNMEASANHKQQNEETNLIKYVTETSKYVKKTGVECAQSESSV